MQDFEETGEARSLRLEVANHCVWKSFSCVSVRSSSKWSSPEMTSP